MLPSALAFVEVFFCRPLLPRDVPTGLVAIIVWTRPRRIEKRKVGR
jgi:hypothetical protein